MIPPPGPPPGAAHGPPPSAPELRPPTTSTATAASGSPAGRGWLILVLVLAVVALAVVVWPGADDDPAARASGEAARPATVPAPAPATPQVPPEEARRAAELALQEFLRQRAELELLGAAAWGAQELAAAAAAAAAGDRQFGERRFSEAAATYTAAAGDLAALAASRPERLAVALAAGWAALDGDDAAGATAAFERALALEPGHPDATRGLERAAVRPEVLQLLNRGRLAEAGGDLAAARDAYLAAAALDLEHAAAGAAAERVEATLAERAFGAAMSRALAALDSGRFDEAQQGLDAAARLRPGERTVADTRRRLAAARQQAELDRLRREAEQLVAAEAWSEAGRLYAQALKIDAKAGFARGGAERAEARHALHARIDHFLADPSRLHSPEPLAEAERLLAAAQADPATEPRLGAKATRLARAVAAAKLPHAVTLRSDGLTEVSVYHVGRLGAFVEHRLELRPGTYTAVGARPGYRDVRVRFTVAADAPPAPVEVRCTEAL